MTVQTFMPLIFFKFVYVQLSLLVVLLASPAPGRPSCVFLPAAAEKESAGYFSVTETFDNHFSLLIGIDSTSVCRSQSVTI